MEEKPISDISYREFLNTEKLMGSRCKECGALYTPPRAICSNCHGTNMGWFELQGKGKLAGYTCIYIGPSSMVQEGYNRKHPYCVGVVELDEGVRVVARIEGLDTTKPETISIGLPLTVSYLHRGEGEKMKTVLAFNPVP